MNTRTTDQIVEEAARRYAGESRARESYWSVWWQKQRYIRAMPDHICQAFFHENKLAYEAGWQAAKEDSKNVR